jgi:hypothetical protein
VQRPRPWAAVLLRLGKNLIDCLEALAFEADLQRVLSAASSSGSRDEMAWLSGRLFGPACGPFKDSSESATQRHVIS